MSDNLQPRTKFFETLTSFARCWPNSLPESLDSVWLARAADFEGIRIGVDAKSSYRVSSAFLKALDTTKGELAHLRREAREALDSKIFFTADFCFGGIPVQLKGLDRDGELSNFPHAAVILNRPDEDFLQGGSCYPSAVFGGLIVNDPSPSSPETESVDEELSVFAPQRWDLPIDYPFDFQDSWAQGTTLYLPAVHVEEALFRFVHQSFFDALALLAQTITWVIREIFAPQLLPLLDAPGIFLKQRPFFEVHGMGRPPRDLDWAC